MISTTNDYQKLLGPKTSMFSFPVVGHCHNHLGALLFELTVVRNT